MSARTHIDVSFPPTDKAAQRLYKKIVATCPAGPKMLAEHARALMAKGLEAMEQAPVKLPVRKLRRPRCSGDGQ